MKKEMQRLPMRFFTTCLLLVPVLALLIFIDFYSLKSLREQVVRNNVTAIENYAQQQAALLEQIANRFPDYATRSDSLDQMQYLPDSADRTFARVSVYEWLESACALYEDLCGHAIYSSYTDTLLRYISADSSLTRTEILALRGWCDQELALQAQEGAPQGWHLATIEGTRYAELSFSYYDLYYCAWIPTEAICADIPILGDRMVSVFLWSPETDQAELLPEDMPYTLTGQQSAVLLQIGTYRNHLVIEQPVGNYGISIVAVIDLQKSLGNLPYLQLFLILFTVLFSIVLVIVLIVYYNSAIRPVTQLAATLERVTNGDLTTRVELQNTSREFRTIGESFNKMMERINELIDSVAQRERAVQKAKLRNFQLQITPHFLMNSLNIIYSAAQTKDFDTVCRMSMYLSNYFRYTIQIENETVSLGSELEFTDSYLNIQSMRFPGKFTYSIDVPAFLLDFQIPPLVVKSFVENSIQHGMSGNYLQVTVSACLNEDGRLCIRIRDNGTGFAPDVLRALQADEAVCKDDGVHIGIQNVRERLRLLYGDDASVKVENLIFGAQVTVILPALRGSDSDVSDSDCG